MATKSKTNIGDKKSASKSSTAKAEAAGSETATVKSDASTPSKEASSTDAPSTDAPSTDAPSTDADSGSADKGKKASTPSRPISYFSSVSSDDYRAGWDGVFKSASKQATGKRVNPTTAKRKRRLPATINLGVDDLDPTIREQLEDLFRQQAKKKRLNYDKLSGNGQISWQISCEISDG